MLHSTALHLLTWYVRDLINRFRCRHMAPQDKGLLFNGHFDGPRDISGLVISPTVASNRDEVLLAGNVFVKRIEWWKKDKLPFHEFLVFYVEERCQSAGETPGKSAFLVDRNIMDGTIDTKRPGEEVGRSIELEFYKDADRNEPSTEAETLSIIEYRPRASPAVDILAFSSGSLNSKRPLSAGDRIIFSTDGTSDFIHRTPGNLLCCTLTIHGDYVSVPEAVLLTRVAHDHHRSYKLMEYQCYWYTEIIYTTMKSLVDKVAKDRHLPLERLLEDVTHNTTQKVGQFKALGQTRYMKRGRADTPAKVCEEYLAAWEVMKEMIAKRVEDMESARRTREMPLRLALEEQTAGRMAAEEGKKAAEEGKKAAEEKARKLMEELEMFKRQYAPGSPTHHTSMTRVAS